MANFLKKLVLNALLDKKSRRIYEANEELLKRKKTDPTPPAATTPAPAAAPPPAPATVDEALLRVEQAKQRGQTRQELIRQALAIRAEKEKLLDALKPEDRERLQAMALQALMGIKKPD